jgi:pimeloyl-ACP methyl ester carboxylesterase
MVTVPLDYAQPTGRQIKIAVSMVRHTAPAASYQGAILVNPGGPGGSGLSQATLGAKVPDGVGADYDWVGFDPRGVGSSVPALRCDVHYDDGPRIPYVPKTQSSTAKWLKRSAGYAADCGRSGGDLLNHLTTADSARDLDSIRKALGQSQISYYGYSYGTYLGQVYGTLFPTHVRRMVLDGVVDARAVWYQANLTQDVAFEHNLRAWFGWLAQHDAAYRLGSTEGAVRERFYAVQASLDAHPAGVVGGDEWADLFTFAGYEQGYWPALGKTFSDWVHHPSQLELETIYRGTTTPGNDNSYAMYLAVECTDTAWPRNVAKNLADSRRLARTSPYLTWQNQWFNAPCITWPAQPHQRVTIDGSHLTSALLVSETLDAATPYPGALETRRLFPHAALVALPGGTSHADTLHGGDECEDDDVALYLGKGELPARRAGNQADATCPPPPQPVPAR